MGCDQLKINILFKLTMPVFCSGSLPRSRQQKSFDLVKVNRVMIKRKASLLLFNQGFSRFFLDLAGFKKF